MKVFTVGLLVLSIFCFTGILPLRAEEKVTKPPTVGTFKTAETEILEVEELKEPAGAAIFKTKDLATGETIDFFVDPYLSLIQQNGKQIKAGEVTGGSKATIIYSESQKGKPEIIFAMVSGSYY